MPTSQTDAASYARARDAHHLATLPIPHAVRDGADPLVLSGGWALTADENQWTLCRARGRNDKWQSIAFVGSNTRVIRRFMPEEGVVPAPEADGR